MQLVYIYGSSLAGALIALTFGFPLPFLLGSLIGSAAFSVKYFSWTSARLTYPKPIRAAFIAIIGTLIGTTFTPEVLGLMSALWPSLLAMPLFIGLATGIGFLIYRYIGGYDIVTSAFSSLPGGLIESVLFGEKLGGQVDTLSLQHFTRVIVVVVSVPFLFFLWTGELVGTAAGLTLETSPAHWQDWLAVFGIAALGYAASTKVKITAGHMIWPLFFSAGLNASGVADISGPSLLLNIAQLSVGAALGTNFAQATLRRMMQGLGLGVIYVAANLLLATGFAWVLIHVVALDQSTLLVSYAPGGLTEMAVIALSLGVSPILVATHHLYRIIATVFAASLLAKYLQSRQAPE